MGTIVQLFDLLSLGAAHSSNREDTKGLLKNESPLTRPRKDQNVRCVGRTALYAMIRTCSSPNFHYARLTQGPVRVSYAPQALHNP